MLHNVSGPGSCRVCVLQSCVARFLSVAFIVFVVGLTVIYVKIRFSSLQAGVNGCAYCEVTEGCVVD